MVKKAGKVEQSGDNFIGERVRDLAVMYLTRRRDLEVRWQDNSEEWIDCIVEIKGKDKPYSRTFGVELRGTMSPVTDDHANKVLGPSMQGMLRKGEFPFPVCLLYFTMQNNEGHYTWIAEPIVDDGKPLLKYHGDADTKKFDKEALDRIVEGVNKWFDVMPADAGSVSCGECGTVLYAESSSLPLADRKPCPRCASTKRAFSVYATTSIRFSSEVATRSEVIAYHQSLLNTAKALVKQKQYNSAIIMTAQACEIATERAIARAFAGKKHHSFAGTQNALSSGYNLTNEKTRKIYTELSGDNIQEQPFWQRFEKFVELRNQIVHGDKVASKSQAELAISAATELVDHLRMSE